MNSLQDWIRTITALVIIIGFFEMLLPDDEMRKFTKLVMGLVIMLAVLQPVIALMNMTWDFSLHLQPALTSEEQPSWEERGNELHNIGSEPVLAVIEESASRHIETILLLLNGVEKVNVSIASRGDQITKITVQVLTSIQERSALDQLRARIGEAISHYFSVSANLVSVEFEVKKEEDG